MSDTPKGQWVEQRDLAAMAAEQSERWAQARKENAMDDQQHPTYEAEQHPAYGTTGSTERVSGEANVREFPFVHGQRLTNPDTGETFRIGISEGAVYRMTDDEAAEFELRGGAG